MSKLLRLRTLGPLGAAALCAVAAAAVATGRTGIAFVALALINALVLIALAWARSAAAREQRRLAAGVKAEFANFSQEMRDRLERLERGLDALHDREELADRRLLEILEFERLRSEERHIELSGRLEGVLEQRSSTAPSDGSEVSGI